MIKSTKGFTLAELIAALVCTGFIIAAGMSVWVLGL